jgi:hypothetical protein
MVDGGPSCERSARQAEQARETDLNFESLSLDSVDYDLDLDKCLNNLY